MSLAVFFRLLPLGGNNDDAVVSWWKTTMVCGSSLGNDDSEDEWHPLRLLSCFAVWVWVIARPIVGCWLMWVVSYESPGLWDGTKTTVSAESFGALGSTNMSSQPCCFFFPVLAGTQIDWSDLCNSQVTYPLLVSVKWLVNYWGSLRCSLPASLTWSAAKMPQVTSPARSSATSQMIVARLKNSFATVFLSSLLRFVCKVMFLWVGWYWYSGCWPLPKWCLAYGQEVGPWLSKVLMRRFP